MVTTRQIGQYAEQFSLAYLLAQQLTFLYKNYHSRYGEIDLIMLDQDCLCFIEVRARKYHSLVNSLETVDIRKQRKIILSAQVFLQQYPDYQDYDCRFDVIAVQYQSIPALLDNHIHAFQQQTVNLHWIKHAYTM